MKPILCFTNVKKIMFDKYNVSLRDWDNLDGTKGRLVMKISYRHENDTLDTYDDESVAKMFAGLADTYGGNIVSLRGVSCDNNISLNPFVFVLSDVKKMD